MDINFYGTVFCTKYALPHILKSKGSVVGVSSIAGYKGLPARTAYSASKFAMQGFLESLRIENLKKDYMFLLLVLVLQLPTFEIQPYQKMEKFR